MQLGVQLHLCPGEAGVIRESSGPAVAAPPLGWTEVTVCDVSPEVPHQPPLLHPGHAGLVSPGEDRLGELVSQAAVITEVHHHGPALSLRCEEVTSEHNPVLHLQVGSSAGAG